SGGASDTATGRDPYVRERGRHVARREGDSGSASDDGGVGAVAVSGRVATAAADSAGGDGANGLAAADRDPVFGGSPGRGVVRAGRRERPETGRHAGAAAHREYERLSFGGGRAAGRAHGDAAVHHASARGRSGRSEDRVRENAANHARRGDGAANRSGGGGRRPRGSGGGGGGRGPEPPTQPDAQVPRAAARAR